VYGQEWVGTGSGWAQEEWVGYGVVLVVVVGQKRMTNDNKRIESITFGHDCTARLELCCHALCLSVWASSVEDSRSVEDSHYWMACAVAVMVDCGHDTVGGAGQMVRLMQRRTAVVSLLLPTRRASEGNINFSPINHGGQTCPSKVSKRSEDVEGFNFSS
jgi:hypothetical protein